MNTKTDQTVYQKTVYVRVPLLDLLDMLFMLLLPRLML